MIQSYSSGLARVKASRTERVVSPTSQARGWPTCPVKGQEAVTALFPREVICYILMLAYSMTCLCFVRAVAFVIGCSLSAYIWRRAVV